MKKLAEFFSREKVILGIYIILSLVVGIQHYTGGPIRFNNFVIFRSALGHVLSQQNLHVGYPAEYFDLFLYHPAFCVLFAPFSLLPVLPGLLLWLVFCSVALFFGVKSLPITQSQKVLFWWFILVELVTSLHGQQTNPLIAALGLFTFSALEKGKTKWAALFPLIAFCIKGYGLIFAGLFLFYPNKRKYIAYSVLWLVLLSLLPLPLTGPSYFLTVYKDWVQVMIQDHQVNYGFSIMGLLKIWFPTFSPDQVSVVQEIGLGLLACTWLFVLIKKRYQTSAERMLLLAYLSLWVILFNHAAESPTYVIAIPGVVLFYIVYQYEFAWAKLLLILVLVFCILAPTDVYPPVLRKQFFEAYLVKVIPCLLVWAALQIQLLRRHEIKSNL